MSMNVSSQASNVWAAPFDVSEPTLGLSAPHTAQSLPTSMLNEYEPSIVNAQFQNEFFEELRWDGSSSVTHGASLDMIINVGFDEY